MKKARRLVWSGSHVLVYVYASWKTNTHRSGVLASLHRPWQTTSRILLGKLYRPVFERRRDCHRYYCEFLWAV
jgi:hypothetical protein